MDLFRLSNHNKGRLPALSLTVKLRTLNAKSRRCCLDASTKGCIISRVHSMLLTVKK